MDNYGYSEEGQVNSIGDLRLWARIFGFCRPHDIKLLLAVLLSLLITAGMLLLPRLLQLGIDHAVTADTVATAERLRTLGSVALGYGLLVVTVFCLTFIQVVLLELIGQSVMHALRQALFAQLLRLDVIFFHEQPVGRLVTRLTNDIQNMNEMFTSIMVTLFNDLLRMGGVFVALAIMNPKLALVMAVFIPLAVVVTVLFSRLARERFRRIRTQLAKLNSIFSESMGGMVVLQAFGQEQTTMEEYAAQSKEYLRRTLEQIRLFGLFMPMTELMSSAAVALIIWYGGGEVIREQLTLGELVAFITYMRLFFQPLRELSQKYSIVQSAVASAERIFELLDEEPGIREAGQAHLPGDSNEGAATVCFEGVSFAYQAGQPVVENITLKVNAGETLALVGATGSGKTTLANLLIRFHDPDQGRIYLDDHPLTSYPLDQLRRRVTVIMQDVFLLPDTIGANITLDLPVDAQRLDRVCRETGLAQIVDDLPDGLDTVIGEGGRKLSVGENQLLAFARALYRSPGIMVLDEATAAVDTRSENMLEKALEAVRHQRTSIIIAHRLSTIRRADRIIVMDKGRIVEEGSHEQLMSEGTVYRHLVQLDMKKMAPAVTENSFVGEQPDSVIGS
ncbi:MAG: ABC transporter ATP-binding protein [Desulfobulbus propionicus]|nr:MAG: ABC transporter ATP-binding protein [Desulfobulbus propionicus]